MSYSIPTPFMRFPGGKAKALTFSYDDGLCLDRRLIEILNSHGMKGTFNVNSGDLRVGEEPYRSGKHLSAEELQEAFADGVHEVAIHSYSHPHLAQHPTYTVARDALKDRETLEGLLGRVVRGMAYPFGSFSDTVVAVLKNCGIVHARTTKSTEAFNLPDEWLLWHPTCHHKNPNLATLTQRFLDMKVWTAPQLFYIWGHTYEFGNDDNWCLIENFTAQMATQADQIWYATNMEIYEYVEDYKRLAFSVDGKTVYNPTGRILYFAPKAGAKAIAVAPGETKTLA